MAIAYNTNIVTSGLVWAVDFGNIKCYPGSGTACYDMIARNTGTLNNSPTYSTSNGGSLAFNGTTQSIGFSNSTALDTQTPSVEVWIKTNALSQNGFWFEKGAVNTQYSLFQEGGERRIQWRQKFAGGITTLSTTATYLNTTSWFQLVGTFTNGSRILYINGVQVNSDTQSGVIDTNASGMTVGSYNAGGYFYNGNIASVKVYNKVLTAIEVRQNFNALRGRFSI